MVVEVGEIIKTKLSSLSFIDRLAGVVRIITKTDQDESNKTYVKKFPAACLESFEACSTGKYMQLLPDSSVGCIVFLEDQGARLISTKGFKQYWKASYTLVGWVNGKKLGKTECSITGQAIASIIGKLSIVPFNNGNYHAVNIQVQGQNPKTGGNPFSKYTIDEEKMQYMMYPNDAFSLQLEVSFEIDKRCLTELEQSTPTEC